MLGGGCRRSDWEWVHRMRVAPREPLALGVIVLCEIGQPLEGVNWGGTQRKLPPSMHVCIHHWRRNSWAGATNPSSELCSFLKQISRIEMKSQYFEVIHADIMC